MRRGLSKILVALVLVGSGCARFEAKPLSECKSLRGLAGPEDFALDHAGRAEARLIVSVQDRRELDDQGAPAIPGRIVSVPVGEHVLGPPRDFLIRGRGATPFHPHGIDLVDQDRGRMLYVINHVTPRAHAIEVFFVQGHELVFAERLRDPHLISPNDVVALPDGNVYATNDHLHSGAWGAIGDLLARPWSNVVHFDGKRWREASGGIAFANGLAVRGARLYVAGLRDHGIHVFQRDVDSGLVLGKLGFIHVGSGVDNLMWTSGSTLMTVGHPSLIAFLAHARDPQAHAPTEVFRLDVDQETVERVFADPGTIIDAGSTAIVHDGWLLMGQVFDPEIVACRAGEFG